MQTTRTQKKQALQASSEALIERLLDWEEKNGAPTLEAIEEEILQLRKQFGSELLKVIVEGQESRQPVMAPACEQCGQPMRYKGAKKKEVVSRVGEFAIERGHYYCQACQQGLFPPR